MLDIARSAARHRHALLPLSLLSLGAPVAAAEGEFVGNVQDVVVSQPRTQSSVRETPPRDGATVVEVITSQQLTRQGAVDLNTALERLIPSFNWPQVQNSGNAVNSIRSASLRGLSPEYTLVLINGKRRHTSAVLAATPGFLTSQQVDLNQIPISAVERVEVLRDGISTLYGGDAVAGTINIVLRQDAEGGGVQGRIGGFKDGGGYSRSINGWAGLPLGEGGFANFAFEAQKREPVDRSGPDFRSASNDGRPTSDYPYTWGDGRLNNYTLTANAELPLTGSARAYAFATLGNRTGEGTLRPVLSSAAANLPSRHPNGFQPSTRARTEDASLNAGVRWGDRASGLFDLSGNYGTNRVRDYAFNDVASSFGEASQDVFFLRSFRNNEFNLQLDYVREFDIGALARPLKLSAGASYRNQRWRSASGDTQSWAYGGVDTGSGARRPYGSAEYVGLAPDAAASISRNVLGVYAGVEVSPIERLELNAIGRYEDYSDAGSATTGQLSGNFKLNPAWALRGTVGTAYKAPALAQYGSVAVSRSWVGGQEAQNRTVRPDDPIAVALGAGELKPMTSQNISLGVSFNPSPEASVSVDIYQLKVKDQIVGSQSVDRTTNPVLNQLLALQGDTTTRTVSFLSNGVDTRTRGLDLISRYRFDLGARGQLQLNLGLSLLDTEITRTSQPIALSNRFVLESGIPRNKLQLGAYYTLGKWSLNLNTTRYGSNKFKYQMFPEDGNEYMTYAAAWIVNAELSHRLSKQFTVAIGANNLTNKYPEKTPVNRRNSGLDQYGHLPAYGSNGAFYYASLIYDF